MNKLVNLITNGDITIEELAAAPHLISDAQLVRDALESLQYTVRFPIGKSTLLWVDSDNRYTWLAEINYPSTAIFKDHNMEELITVDLTKSSEVFAALESDDENTRSAVRCFLQDQHLCRKHMEELAEKAKKDLPYFISHHYSAV